MTPGIRVRNIAAASRTGSIDGPSDEPSVEYDKKSDSRLVTHHKPSRPRSGDRDLRKLARCGFRHYTGIGESKHLGGTRVHFRKDHVEGGTHGLEAVVYFHSLQSGEDDVTGRADTSCHRAVRLAEMHHQRSLNERVAHKSPCF